MRDTNESTNSRVLYFSIFSMCCLLGLATWQVLYRSFTGRFLRRAPFLFQVSSTQLLLYSFHPSPLLLYSFHLSSLLLYSFHLFSDIALYLPLIPWYLAISQNAI